MKSIAEERIGQPVRQAVITVPAYFNDNQRQATRDAGRIAGLEVLRLLNEPTAAALAYGFGRGLNQRVAVYDLGGGTFDVSILEIGKDVFEVLSTCGDTYLGGDDLDDRLIDLLADEFLAREGINLRGDPFSLEKLKHAAETAKKTLSVEESVEINIPDICVGADGGPRSVQRTITSQEYGALIMDLIQRTFKVCDEALQQANLIARDLDGVILVGGPTRLPIIRTAVREYFQQEPKSDVNPDEVVAMGAAIHAASLVAPTQQSSSYLLDVTPLSLRIGVAGGLAEPVIERNTPVPIEQTRTFTTVQDQQERVKIRVYQGESRRADENELLGQFEFSGFKRAPRGEVRIDVTFEINGDGIVNVTACDRETGQQASTEIMLSSGLSPQEMEKILAQRRTDRVQTATASGAPVAARSEGAPRAASKGGVRAAPTPVVAPSRQTAAAPPRPQPAAPPPAASPPPPAASAKPAPAVPPAVPLAPAPATNDDDLEVLPDDDLDAVIEEVSEGVRLSAPPPVTAPAPAAFAAAERELPVAAPEPEHPDDDLIGPMDVVQDEAAAPFESASPFEAAEPEAAAAPPEFEATLPSEERELELDAGDLESVPMDLGEVGEFSTGVDGGPMIGGAAEFSEDDFGGTPSDEDPNAKTQPDLEGQTLSRPAAPAPVTGDELFDPAGADLSIFGDDDEAAR
jgi:molecular chaperone DnaK